MYLKNSILYSDISKITIFLIASLSLGLIIRFNYLQDNIPLTLDSLDYFLLATDISILGNLPIGHNVPNNGWPLFLSIIFQTFSSENFLDYMMIQRMCSVILSVLTTIPLFFLAKKFFKKEIAMVGACFFIFSPYMIENSLLGITDSLFIFLTTSFLALFFSKKKVNVLSSFLILGISTFIRYESFLLIFPAVMIFIYRYNENKFRKYLVIGIVLFLVVITPIAIWNYQMGIPYGLTNSVSSGVNIVINENSINSNTSDRFDIVRGIYKLPQYFGISLLPLCLIFIPYSIIPLLKKQNKNFRYLVYFAIVSAIPAFYAYSRGFEEIRYMLFISPVLIVASLFLIEKLDLRVKKNVIPISLIILIILSSLIYLDFRQSNQEYELEAIEVARFVSDIPGKVNGYGKEAYYVEAIELENHKFPILSSEIHFPKRLTFASGNTLDEIFKNFKNSETEYLAIKESSMEANPVLKEIFYEENPYFVKIYDSKENNLKEFSIKIFRLNFEKFELEN